MKPLPPRLKQTLTCLLAGDSEKQAARRLGLSPHTVHVYVKSLYRRFGVNSRGELLAGFVAANPTDKVMRLTSPMSPPVAKPGGVKSDGIATR